MAGDDYLWGQVASSVRAGNLQFKQRVVVDLMNGARDLVAHLKGVQQLTTRDPFLPVSEVRDGSDVAALFHRKATEELKGVLDSHLAVLDDQAAAFRAVGVRYYNTEVINAEQFAKIRPTKLSVSTEAPAGSGSLTTAYRPGMTPQGVAIRWVDPMSKSYRELYNWGTSINWYPALTAQTMWNEVAGHVRRGFETYQTVLDSAMKAGPSGTGGWESDGADAARTAVHRYIKDIDTLNTAMASVGDKLSTTAEVLQRAYNVFKNLPHPDQLTDQQRQQLETGQLWALRMLMKMNYTSGLQSSTSGIPVLPQPVSPVTDSLDTPHRRTETAPRTRTDDRITGVRNRSEDEHLIPGFRSLDDVGPEVVRTIGPDIDGMQPFEPGGTDSLSEYPTGTTDQPRDLGQGNTGGITDPALMGARDPRALAGHGGAGAAGAAGLAAQSTARPTPRAGGGAGGGGSRGGVPRAGELSKRPAAQLFPRAGAPSAEPAGRAGPRAGVPGAPGAPAPAARRHADRAEDKEHKSAEYLNSEEHLGDAIGRLPPAYRPVVDR
ncbi:WXG100 family type VII secretion target [Nocardia sp. KC 131]|uniref:WXG100 family type VII secretion target n=1 Tax=Nocardia arseniciresistens TaxID=3392119 RepID=UPI00398F29FF